MSCIEDCYKECSWKKVLGWGAATVVLGGVIVVLVIAFGVFWPPKATVDDAVLTRFAVTPGAGAANSTIDYDIAATLSFKNPNIYRVIKYVPPLDMSASFNGTKFGEATLLPFQGKPGKTATSHVTLRGAGQPVKLDAAALKEFRAENETGKFDVELRLDATLQYKGRKTKCPLVVVCPLKLQLADPGVAATAFQKTKCTVLRARKYGC